MSVPRVREAQRASAASIVGSTERLSATPTTEQGDEPRSGSATQLCASLSYALSCFATHPVLRQRIRGQVRCYFKGNGWFHPLWYQSDETRRTGTRAIRFPWNGGVRLVPLT